MPSKSSTNADVQLHEIPMATQSSPRLDPPHPLSTFFAIGFRPFFVAALIYGVLIIPLWVLMLAEIVPSTSSLSPIIWHGHELIYGFVSAVIVGFLLTASANWTGLRTLHGPGLVALTGLWITARILAITPIDTGRIFAIVDLLFIPLATIAFAVPIVRARNIRNLKVLVLMAFLFTGNFFIHGQSLLGQDLVGQDMGRFGLHVGVITVISVITLIGSRVLPFFTRRVAKTDPAPIPGWLPALTQIATICALISGLLLPASLQFVVPLCIVAILAHGAGLWLWFDPVVLKTPMLWILYYGYLWVPIGLLLLASTSLGLVTGSAALHALTSGAMACLIAGMVARVTRGHTGRPITHDRSTLVAFCCVALVPLIRVFGGLVSPANPMFSLHLSSALWFLGFGILAVVHLPMLWSPRVDGRLI